jgi:chemotaxis methyl-accepting protein methylase
MDTRERVLKHIEKGNEQERKKTVQAEFLKKQEAYRNQKAQEVREAVLSRIAAEKKRNTPAEARNEFGRFRMTEQERVELQAVCKALTVTESQFLRDSVREAVMLIYNEKVK